MRRVLLLLPLLITGCGKVQILPVDYAYAEGLCAPYKGLQEYWVTVDSHIADAVCATGDRFSYKVKR